MGGQGVGHGMEGGLERPVALAGGHRRGQRPPVLLAHALGHGLAIISEQCPFGGAAVQHPVICAVDRGIVKGMLDTLYGDTVPETSASRPLGDDICITLV